MPALHSAMLAIHKAAAYILLPIAVMSVMTVYTLNHGFFAVYIEDGLISENVTILI